MSESVVSVSFSKNVLTTHMYGTGGGGAKISRKYMSHLKLLGDT
jgi:hypothetical protein